MWGLTAKVVNADTAISQDGGILVAASREAQGPLDKGDVAVHLDWRFRGATGLVKPTIEMIAPGLAVYRLPATGPIVLEDAKHSVVAKATGVAAAKERPAAPRVTSIRYTNLLHRRSRTMVTVTLDAAPPAGTVALVLADGKGVPRSWGFVTGAKVDVYSSGDCVALPNGTLPSTSGDKVSVFFVDDAGRKSDASKVTTITPAP